MTPLKYLFQQLGMGTSDWTKLDSETKDWYKKAAAEEMAFMGIK